MNKQLNLAIGRRIKLIRQNRDISQGNLAASLFSNRSMCQKYESGAVTPPITFLKNFATELGVSLDWLIAEKGKMYMKNKEENLSIAIETDYFKEAGELLYFMEKIPMIRHALLAHFQKLKTDNNDIIQSAMLESG